MKKLIALCALLAPLMVAAQTTPHVRLNSIAALVAQPILSTNVVATVASTASNGVGEYNGGSTFVWLPGSSVTTNVYDVFASSTGASGRWVRLRGSITDALWAGSATNQAVGVGMNPTLSSGALQVNGGLTFNGAQTIQTSSGALTLNPTTTVNLQSNGSAFTSKSLLFCGSSGAISQDNSNFQYDPTGPSLSIGSSTDTGVGLYVLRSGAKGTYDQCLQLTSTATKASGGANKTGLEIDVSGSWNGVVTGLLINTISGGTTNWALYNNTAANVYLGSGAVGIGTTTPSAKLSINGGAHVGGDSDPGDNNLLVDGTTMSTGDVTATANLILSTAGSTLMIKEGSNATMGTSTLNGATEVTISTTKVTANSRIFLSIQAPGGTPAGAIYVSSRSPGVSFGVKGIAADTSTFAWMIVEPAP